VKRPTVGEISKQNPPTSMAAFPFFVRFWAIKLFHAIDITPRQTPSMAIVLIIYN
jgi:hypothetical protein